MKNKFFMQWHITDECDQRCKHCYIFANKANATFSPNFSELKRVFYSFLEMCDKLQVIPAISLTGGDPLLSPYIWDILALLHEKNIEFHILGNPFHLNQECAYRLKELGCTSYQLSLDGLQKTHDSIRRFGSFNSTLKAIKTINDAGISSTIMTTVSALNIDDIPDLVDIVVENKASGFGFARYCPNEGEYHLMIAPNEYRVFLSKMWEKYEQHKNATTQFTLKDHLWKLFLYEKGLFRIPDTHDTIIDGCHCAISHITVTTNGDIYACRRSHTKVGHLPDTDLYDAFISQKMDQYRLFSSFEKCTRCELLCFCRGCPSVSNGLTRNFYGPDPQCWKNV